MICKRTGASSSGLLDAFHTQSDPRPGIVEANQADPGLGSPLSCSWSSIQALNFRLSPVFHFARSRCCHSPRHYRELHQ